MEHDGTNQPPYDMKICHRSRNASVGARMPRWWLAAGVLRRRDGRMGSDSNYECGTAVRLVNARPDRPLPVWPRPGPREEVDRRGTTGALLPVLRARHLDRQSRLFLHAGPSADHGSEWPGILGIRRARISIRWRGVDPLFPVDRAGAGRHRRHAVSSVPGADGRIRADLPG